MMKCSHADTTTLLWLYGEGEESHAEHVASCADCQAVAAEHANVMSALAGASYLDLEPAAEDLSLAARPRPANRWGRALAVGFIALAAATVLVVPRPQEPALEPVDLDRLTFDTDPLDARFDQLAVELGDLAVHVEEETL